MYPGYEQLREYLNKANSIEFYDFINTNKENVAIWSATCNLDSSHMLYAAWKGRFTKMCQNEGRDRIGRINYDEELWKDILQHTVLIRRNKNAYKLQGLEILARSSLTCGKEVLRSMENDTPTSKEVSANNSSTERDLHNSGDIILITDVMHATPKIQCPADQNRYHLGDVDISLLFYAFQVVAMNNQNELNMEEHVQHVFALSSILLVQDDRWHPDIKGIFGGDNLQNIHKTLQEKFSVGAFTPAFSKQVSDAMAGIVRDLKRGKATRMDAQVDLLVLARKSSINDAKIIRSVSTLIEKLPKQALKDDIMEAELCHRYVDALLSPLFDDPDEGVLFRWTSVTNQESRSLNSGSISKKRPDCCISELDGLYFDASLGFVEVKPASQNENKQALSKDLVRLGMLSKNAIDGWSIRGCLAIQVVGYEATFFLNTRLSSELYAMLELCAISIPTCLADLPTYLAQVDDIAATLQCYDNWCVHIPFDETQQHEDNRRATLSDEEFDKIAASPKSNKRRCYTMH